MPARVEELHHALEEGIELKVLRSPARVRQREIGSRLPHRPRRDGARAARRFGPAFAGRHRQDRDDARSISSSWRSATRRTRSSRTASRAQDHASGARSLSAAGSQKTSLEGVYSGGDATRGGSTAVHAAGDGQAAAREIVGDIPFSSAEIEDLVEHASRYTDLAQAPQTILKKVDLAEGIVEMTVTSPMIAKAAQAGQFVRVLPTPKGELIPLTLADWDAKAGTIDLVIQGVGASSIGINPMEVGEAFAGIAGPLGQPSKLHRYEGDETVVFCAGGLGLPPVYPIMRAHLRLGNHVTLIAGFRTRELAVLDRRGRARRQAAEGVRRPARGDLRQQRRHLRRQGLRHRARWRSS